MPLCPLFLASSPGISCLDDGEFGWKNVWQLKLWEAVGGVVWECWQGERLLPGPCWTCCVGEEWGSRPPSQQTNFPTIYASFHVTASLPLYYLVNARLVLLRKWRIKVSPLKVFKLKLPLFPDQVFVNLFLLQNCVEVHPSAIVS